MQILSHILMFAAVNFAACDKCPDRIRISEDGRTAFVNTARFEGVPKEEMSARAELLLSRGRPVKPDDRRTPLMGWSSWNTFGVDISQDIILGVAKAMSTNGLKEAGYVYVNTDDGFFDGHDSDGRLRFSPARFPAGLKPVVDGIHALGMKAGIYSDAGINTCVSYMGDKSGINGGLYGRDRSDCRTFFNELGYDFIKVDYCGGHMMHLEERARFTEIAEAIRATGRDVRFNICRWAFPGTWAADIAGSWRTTRDIRASWKSIRGIIAENLYLSAYASPGHFNDLDMLEVGQYKGTMKSAFTDGKGDVGITPDEETAHFGMWCIMSSPLVLGCDVRSIPPSTHALVTNPYLLWMNQDPLGLQAYVADRDGDAYQLVKDAETRFGKARYVALYNAGDKEHLFRVRAEAFDLAGRIEVFDLVRRADVGCFTGETSVTVAPHAAKFYLFDAEKRLDRKVYEAETAYLSDYSEVDESGHGTRMGFQFQCRPAPKPHPLASGGVAVIELGGRPSNDLIWKEVKVSKSGRYKLDISYLSKGRHRIYVQIDGGLPVKYPLEDTGEKFVSLVHEAELSAGVHTVRLFNAWAKMPVIDKMEISAL